MLYLDDFITGKLKGNTPLAEMLYKDIEEYYRKCCLEYSTEKSSCMSFEEHIFNLCVDDLILNQKQFREQHPEYKPFLVDNWSVHYYSEADSYKPSLPYNTFGLDCIDYFSGETLNVKNSLIGLCGEFVAESDLARNSLKALGMPLELYINETKKVKYYPLVNVRTENNTFLEPRLNNNVYYIPEEHTLVTENDDIDKIINSFLSWRNNFKELSHSVSTRLSFSDIEVLNTIESRLKELEVF